MAINFYNTLKRRKEIFKSINPGFVGLYTCGPTVYNYSHIGNFSTFIFEDLLKKWLVHSGFKVKHIMNITDVDDKTIQKSKDNNISLQKLTDYYESKFKDDLNWLKIEDANLYPKATDSITEMISMISALLEAGYAYLENDSSVYFKINSYKDYGNLSNIVLDAKKLKRNILKDEYDKKSPQDFALWKGYKKSDGEIFWESPWGKGRPGWHIECSAMSMKYLGNSFDIHCGGVDNIFPHHENEIAQSECFSGKKFVNYWMHSEHLMIDKNKMSKSEGNFYTIEYLKKYGFKPGSLRYLLLSGHYRTRINFSLKSKIEGNRVIDRVESFARRLRKRGVLDLEKSYLIIPKEYFIFKENMDNDLDTPKALAVFFNYMKLINKKMDNNNLSIKELGKSWRFLNDFNNIFNFIDMDDLKIPKFIKRLLKLREQKRDEKNWKASDILRSKISEEGYIVEDSKNGQIVKKKEI